MVPQVHLRPITAVDSKEDPEVANLSWAIPVSVHRDAVAADDRGSDRARATADGMAVVDADCRGVAVADSVASTGCADVSDCRLWDWHGCCDRKSCPLLRGPWEVGNARPCFFS